MATPFDASAPAWDGVTETLYEELRSVAAAMMRHERDDHTLEPTAVVNEACLRLAKRGLPDLPREQRLAIAARVLGQVLVDHARAHNALKRGAGRVRVHVDHADLAVPADAPQDDRTLDFQRVHHGLTTLRALHPRQSEVATLRIFAGLSTPQIADLLGVSSRTVEGDWAVARAWLRRALTEPAPAP